MGENVRAGRPELTLPETFPVVCNSCQLPVCTPAGHAAGYLDSPLPYQVQKDVGRERQR
jgi:toluene monooxygenase system protein A